MRKAILFGTSTKPQFAVEDVMIHLILQIRITITKITAPRRYTAFLGPLGTKKANTVLLGRVGPLRGLHGLEGGAKNLVRPLEGAPNTNLENKG